MESLEEETAEIETNAVNITISEDEKPQEKFEDKIDNDEKKPFRHTLKEKPNALLPLG